MATESIAVVVLAIFVFLAFYFAFLSFYTIDVAQREGFVLLAVSSVVSSAILFGVLIFYHVIKRAFSRMNNRLKDAEEPYVIDEA